jgi:hypothetical protein
VTESFNLPLLRVWCRKHDAWLSFKTRDQDRYFINPYGYYIEMPDGRLAQITARVAFPLVNCYPSVGLHELDVQSGFGSASYFVYALRDGDGNTVQPRDIKLSQLRYELEQILSVSEQLTPPERYLAVRMMEAGYLTEEQVRTTLMNRSPGTTLGQAIVSGELCKWEVLLGACLDTRSPGNFDPPGHAGRTFLREWELAGEILIAMGKVPRSKLEYALKIKKDGARILGEILTAAGACSDDQVDECLLIQNAVRDVRGSEVGLIGELLVRRGLIQPHDLIAALQQQKYSGQTLAQVLLTLRYCQPRDIDEYKTNNGWHSFQGEIEDNNLVSWLLMSGRISEQQVKHAVAIQGRGRQALGEVIAGMGLVTEEQVEATLRVQEETRAAFRAGIERIGSILLSKGVIIPDQLEYALHAQVRGRKALGEILMSVGGCSEYAVRFAIELQRRWREMVEYKEDRLGEVLVQRGLLTSEALNEAMNLQQSTATALGRILVEKRWCTPEEIIATLLMRDYKRQCDLHSFIKRSIDSLPEAQDEGVTTERLLSSWLRQEKKSS